MKLKLPKEIESLPDGYFKRDMIRHYKKSLRKVVKNGKRTES